MLKLYKRIRVALSILSILEEWMDDDLVGWQTLVRLHLAELEQGE